MTIKQILSYGLSAMQVNEEDIDFFTLPGFAQYVEINEKNWSYFFCNLDEVDDLMEKIER